MISPLISNRKHSRTGIRPAGDSPLDLSFSHKKPTKEDDGPCKKLPKWSSSLDPSSITPLLANHHQIPHHNNLNSQQQQLHHSSQRERDRKNSWNGNHNSPDIKALEKMSEMSRGGQDGAGGNNKLSSPSGRG